MHITATMFNDDVLLVMDYGIKAWTLPTTIEETLAMAQRKIERIMRGITLRDSKINTWIQQQIRHNMHKHISTVHVSRLEY